MRWVVTKRREIEAEYRSCLWRILAAHGSPSVDEIAARTRGMALPLSPDQVEGYVIGAEPPGSSAELRMLWRGITNREGPASVDEELFRLWRSTVDQPTEPEPEPDGPVGYIGSGPPEILEWVVEVASY